MKKDVIFYLSGDDARRHDFVKEVVSLVPQNRRMICDSVNELSAAMREMVGRQSICVVLTKEKRDLLNLFQVQDLLRESRLILILPDLSDESVELGHLFYPRFSDSINSGFENTAAVLARMAELELNTPVKGP